MVLPTCNANNYRLSTQWLLCVGLSAAMFEMAYCDTTLFSILYTILYTIHTVHSCEKESTLFEFYGFTYIMT